MKNSVPKPPFKGYARPNYTPVPDELFDKQLPDLTGAELKVLLYIIRRTTGFKKESDNISISQLLTGITTREGQVLDRGTGLSKKTLFEAIKSLVDQNYIIAERRRSETRGDEPTTYRLHMLGDIIENPRGVETTPGGGVETTPGGGEENSPRGSDNYYSSQETELQQTEITIRNSSKNTRNESNTNEIRHGETNTIGEVLRARAQAAKTAKSKLKPTDEIKAVVKEISQEFGDRRNQHGNITRVMNIVEKSGRNIEGFSTYLYTAKSITKQTRGVKKRMPYFFTVLEEQVGVH